MVIAITDNQAALCPVKRRVSEPRSVYIIDDMVGEFQFLGSALSGAGFQAVLCENAEQFIDSYHGETAEAVFIDVHLGQSDATDILDFLKDAGCRSPLFLISGDPEGMINTRRYAEQIDLRLKGTIGKPFTGKAIVDALIGQTITLGERFGQLDIGQGFTEGWLYPVFQPKLDLAHHKILSAELLCRMQHPDYGNVSPATFLSNMTEKQNCDLLLNNIDTYIREFLYTSPYETQYSLNINVKASTLADCFEDILTISKQHSNFFSRLMLEITEDSLVTIQGNELKRLYQLSLAGARFSVDDFGSGLSNFLRLSKFPVHEVKIDRSIIDGCAESRERGIMIRTLVTMSHELGIRVVAEGVERLEDFVLLEKTLCDEIQGFFVARPMRLASFRDFSRRFNDEI